MKNIFITLVFLLCGFSAFAQDCNLSDEAKRHMLKAEGMRETMQTTEDMQLVANEYEQAAQAALYCPDIYYNLGLCYEELGKKQPELFDKAVACYQKYLQLNPTAENKSEVENLIYKIEGKKEMTQRQLNQEKEKDLENEILGNWEGGFELENFSIINDSHIIKLVINPWKHDDGSIFYDFSQCEITMRNNIFYFSFQSTDYVNRGYIGSKEANGWVDEFTTVEKWQGTFELLSDGRLQCTMSLVASYDIDKNTGKKYDDYDIVIRNWSDLYLNRVFFCEKKY